MSQDWYHPGTLRDNDELEIAPAACKSRKDDDHSALPWRL
jgi:hypothetical protein